MSRKEILKTGMITRPGELPQESWCIYSTQCSWVFADPTSQTTSRKVKPTRTVVRYAVARESSHTLSDMSLNRITPSLRSNPKSATLKEISKGADHGGIIERDTEPAVKIAVDLAARTPQQIERTHDKPQDCPPLVRTPMRNLDSSAEFLIGACSCDLSFVFCLCSPLFGM